MPVWSRDDAIHGDDDSSYVANKREFASLIRPPLLLRAEDIKP